MSPKHCCTDLTLLLSLLGMEDHPIMQLKVNQNPHVLLNSASLPLHLDCSRMKKMANKPNSTVSEMTAARDTLIVLTTKNNLQMTMLALDYLKSAQDDADLIIIDDNSSDGTVEYLIKRGYAVFGKSSTTGWTDSLNRGYQIAYQLGYSYVIYTTNDVLVSSWAVRGTKDALKSEALIAPLTSKRGADHNPSQVSALSLYCSDSFSRNFTNRLLPWLMESAMPCQITLRTSATLKQSREALTA